MLTDEADVELIVTPVDICATQSVSLNARYMNHTALYTNTQTGDAQVMRQHLHASLSKAISEQCGCYFPVEHIRAGVFR